MSIDKNRFSLALITKAESKELLLTHHYLKDKSKTFKSGFNVGLFCENQLVGVCIFTAFPVPELVVGMFGLPRTEQNGFFELSRLCILPEIQEKCYNITSWFVSRSIKFLRKQEKVKCILSYADSEYHHGIIYRACNFNYYGLTEPKTDFWKKQEDGSYIKHSRGKTKGVPGKWLPRSRKHRYALIFDKKLNMKWNLVKYEKDTKSTNNTP